MLQKSIVQRLMYLGVGLTLLMASSSAFAASSATFNDALVDSEARALSVTEMDPATAPNDIDVPVTITGADFINTPTVILGETELLNVSFDSTISLSATVPWGMIPGTYDLKVVNPGGEEAALVGAFTVTEGLGNAITNGPFGGETVQLKLKPGNPDTVYALMFGAGLFRSDDGAGSWQAIHDHDWPIQLDFDSADPNILYFGADSSDLYRSNDNGGSWVRLSTELNTEVGCFKTYPAAHPRNGGGIYFGMGSCAGMSLGSDEGGVYYSSNHGDTWALKISNQFTDRDVQSLAIRPDSPYTLLAGTYNGNLFYSSDGGDSWQKSTDSLLGSVDRLWFNPHKPGHAFALATEHAGLGLGSASHFYMSTDLDTWTEITTISVGSWGQMAFLPGEIWLASNGLYRYTDSSGTWQPVSASSMPHPPNALVISPNNSQVMMVGTGAGVEKSTDGGATWLPANDGLAGIVPQAIAVSPHDMNTLFVKTPQGIFKSTTAGNSWQNLFFGGSGFPGGENVLAVDHFQPDTVYFGNECTGEFCIFISTNSGLTWYLKGGAAAPLPSSYSDQRCGAYAIAPSTVTPGRVVVGATILSESGMSDSRGIFFISSDSGQTWTQGAFPAGMKWIKEIQYDAFDPTLMYAATFESGLWRSEDSGASWSRMPVIDGVSPLTVNAIAVHPNIPDKVYIKASDASQENPESPLYISLDRGETWVERPYITAWVDLIVAPALPDQRFYSLYSGCSGLCRSTNDGLTWVANTSIPRPEILIAAAEGDRSIIYLGTPGGLASDANSRAETIPGLGSINGAGIYRLIPSVDAKEIFLPIFMGSEPP